MEAGSQAVAGAAAPAPRCGDNHVDPGELCDGNCPASCDDGDPCTKDALTGSDCNVRCVSAPITASAADGCCPDGASSLTDSDCSVSCGNGVVEAGETCDGDCPTACNDGDACTSDRLVGAAARCTAECISTAIGVPVNGDACCPKGANATNDNDCKPKCGNGVVESGEACDGNCPTSCAQDSDPCTVNEFSGSPLTCSAKCTVKTSSRGAQPACDGWNDAFVPPVSRDCIRGEVIASTSECKWLCQSRSAPKNTPCEQGGACVGPPSGVCKLPEAPAAVCGDGVKNGSEQCDTAVATWECGSDCRSRNRFIACANDDACGGGEQCISGACVVPCLQWPAGSGVCPTVSAPPSAQGELLCWTAGDDTSNGWCRPKCSSISHCPRGMVCVEDKIGTGIGACFPG